MSRQEITRHGIFLTFGLVLPTAYILFFQQHFGYPDKIVYLHVSFLTILWATPLLAGRFSLFRRITFIPLLLLPFFFGLIIIYVISYFSNKAWGENITYSIAATYLRHPELLFSLSPFDQHTTIALFALVGLLLFTMLALLYLFSQKLWLSLSNCRDPETQTRRIECRTVFAVLDCVPPLLFVAAAFFLGLSAVYAPGNFVGEPISDFFDYPGKRYLIRQDTVRLQAALEDRPARRDYPTDIEFSKKNVVLIFVDSLRADHMGVFDYQRETTPFLSDLFRQGLLHRVDMSFSTCSESYCGISTTLASKHYHQVSEESLKLHEILMKVGYDISFLMGDHCSWPYIRDFYRDVDFCDRQGTIHSKHSEYGDRFVIEQLDKVQNFSGTPRFFYFFLMSAHVASEKGSQFEKYTPATLSSSSFVQLWNEIAGTKRLQGKVVPLESPDDSLHPVLRNRYDNGVLQADSYIKEIFAALQQKGYLQESIVVILGDHGDGLGEHGHFGHSRYLYQEDIGIPILIYDTGKDVYRNKRYASQVDIAPTILDRLGLPVPSTWVGTSLISSNEKEFSLHQTRRGKNICRAIVKNHEGQLYKFIRCGSETFGFTEEFYNLSNDPEEKKNLIADDNELLFSMRSQLSRQFRVTINTCSRFECVD